MTALNKREPSRREPTDRSIRSLEPPVSDNELFKRRCKFDTFGASPAKGGQPVKLVRIIFSLALLVVIGACSESTEDQMEKYLEFYYPSTGSYFYDIRFEWGHAENHKVV